MHPWALDVLLMPKRPEGMRRIPSPARQQYMSGRWMAPAKGKKPALQCLNWFMLHVHWFEVESQLSTRKKRTMATHLERSGRHLWMNLKMEMAL